jgi:hypothetical protein
MRPESEKPRIPAQDSVRAYTDRTDRALKHPDPATGKPIPEPESVDAVEIEEMARDNRTRFELMKAEERTNQQWQAALEGLGREMREAMVEGRATGGTIHFGDFHRTWKSDQTF